MNLKVLKFQNKKLAERMEEMKMEEEKLKEQVVELKKQKESDMAIISVINRHWMQVQSENMFSDCVIVHWLIETKEVETVFLTQNWGDCVL